MSAAISLRRRLRLALLILFTLGIIAASSYFYFDTHGTYEAVRARTLQQQASELLAAGPPGTDGRKVANVPAGWAADYARHDSGFQFTYYDAEGRIVAASANLKGFPPLPLTDPPAKGRQFGRVHFVGPQAVPSLTARVPGTAMLLVVARGNPDTEALAESLFEERAEPIYVVLPFGVAALVLAWLIVGWTLRPLDRASREAARIGPDDLTRRIAAGDLPVEIRPLVDSFNGALDRLATAYDRERRFTADAAHELRTPVSVLSLRLQRAKLEGEPIPWPAIEDDIGRLTRMTARLLDLARRESGAAGDCVQERVDLARVARAAAASLLPIAEANGRAIVVTAPDSPVLMRGSKNDLTEMIVNLVENGIVHGSGMVAVKVAARPAKNDVRFVVSDEGRGIAAELAPGIFERFRKGDTGSSGSGLGLAIVRKIAELHGGRIECLPGPGARFEAIFPAAEA